MLHVSGQTLGFQYLTLLLLSCVTPGEVLNLPVLRVLKMKRKRLSLGLLWSLEENILLGGRSNS